MSDYTRCPYCKAITYIDDRYCPVCLADMRPPTPGYKPDAQSGNNYEHK